MSRIPHSSRRASGTPALVVLLFLLASSCAPPEADEGGAADTQNTAQESVSLTDRSEERMGDGIVRAVSGAPTTGGLLIVTTVGWGQAAPGSNEVATLQPLEFAASAATTSSALDLLAVVSADEGRMAVHDLESGEALYDRPLDTISANRTGVFAVDGTRSFDVVTSSTIERWDDHGDAVTLLEADSDAELEAVARSEDGRQWFAVQRSADTSTRVLHWAAELPSARSMPADTATQVSSIVLSPDGTTVGIETQSVERGLVLAAVDISTWETVAEYSLDSGPLDAWTLHDDLSATIVRGGVVERIAEDVRSFPVPDYSDVRELIALQPQSGLVGAVRDTGAIVVIDTALDTVVQQLSGSGRPLATVQRLSDGSIVGIDTAGVVVAWPWEFDTSGFGDIIVIDDYWVDVVTDVDISRDAAIVAVARERGSVDVRSADSITLDHRDRNVDSIAFAPNSEFIVTGIGERLGATAFDDTITKWGLSRGTADETLGGEGEPVAGCSFFRNLVRFSPDGQSVAVNSHDFTVSIRNADDFSPELTLTHPNNVLDFAFSPDGSTLLTSGEDWFVRTWDVDDGALLTEWPTPLGGYWAVAFTPDGDRIAAVGSTGQVDLIDLRSGEAVQQLDGAASWSSNIVVTPDRRLIAGGPDGDVLVWDESGSIVDRLVGHTREVTSVAVSADGRWLISGSADGTARTWSLDSA